MSKFTEGPWEYQKYDTDFGPVFMVTAQDDAGTYAICEIHEDCEMDERAPNAKLIAAAPDMYEALKEALEMSVGGAWNSDHILRVERQIRAALAKVQP